MRARSRNHAPSRHQNNLVHRQMEIHIASSDQRSPRARRSMRCNCATASTAATINYTYSPGMQNGRARVKEALASAHAHARERRFPEFPLIFHSLSSGAYYNANCITRRPPVGISIFSRSCCFFTRRNAVVVVVVVAA